MDAEVVRVCEWLGIFVPVLVVVRDVKSKHCGDQTIEVLELAVRLLVVRQRERVKDALNSAGVLVELAYKQQSVV